MQCRSLRNILKFFYYVNFPLTEIEIKPRTLWFNKGLRKSSKTEQRLYIKFGKNKGAEYDKKNSKLQKSF